MTDREIMQQALDALEFPHDSEWSNKAKAIEALQNALTQPELEPVAWAVLRDDGRVKLLSHQRGVEVNLKWIPLYALDEVKHEDALLP